MPKIVSGNTNAPVVAIAELASDLIKADFRKFRYDDIKANIKEKIRTNLQSTSGTGTVGCPSKTPPSPVVVEQCVKEELWSILFQVCPINDQGNHVKSWPHLVKNARLLCSEASNPITLTKNIHSVRPCIFNGKKYNTVHDQSVSNELLIILIYEKFKIYYHRYVTYKM